MYHTSYTSRPVLSQGCSPPIEALALFRWRDAVIMRPQPTELRWYLHVTVVAAQLFADRYERNVIR
eukprot:COSAG02_NODE_45410_length_357_cov_0.992248_1_plen_65_part_10